MCCAMSTNALPTMCCGAVVHNDLPPLEKACRDELVRAQAAEQ
jgi:hypothetical protein